MGYQVAGFIREARSSDSEFLFVVSKGKPGRDGRRMRVFGTLLILMCSVFEDLVKSFRRARCDVNRFYLSDDHMLPPGFGL